MEKGNKYLFKFYLHARHFVRIKDSSTEIHPHTWEISLYVLRNAEEEQRFKDIETSVEDYFQKYENQLMNEVPPFTILNPTMENMGKIFYKELSELLQRDLSLSLDTLEISENPTRTYIVNQYETYFQDMRKEVENEILRFKQENHVREKKESPFITMDKEVEELKPTKIEVKKEEIIEVPLRPRKEKGKKKKRKFNKLKLITGIIAVIAVGFLIAYRTML